MLLDSASDKYRGIEKQLTRCPLTMDHFRSSTDYRHLMPIHGAGSDRVQGDVPITWKETQTMQCTCGEHTTWHFLPGRINDSGDNY
jgi:hypothetical protein